MRHTLLVTIALLARAADAPAANWSFWRGPEQTGASRERDLPAKFALGKPGENNLVFTAPIGSRCAPIVQNGQVYLLSQTGAGPTIQERVVAVDANTGAVKWKHDYNVWHTDIVDYRLASTHLAGDPETGNVYAHLTAGQFICFSKDGKVVWERSLTEELGRVSGYGGRITSPIVDEDKVLISMASSSWGEQSLGMTRMVAFDKKTWKVIWWGSGGYRVTDTYASTPVVAVIAGQRLVLTTGGDGCVHAFKVRTGEKVWSYQLEDNGGPVNCSPVVKGDKVWLGHGEENQDNTQGRVICLDGGKVKDGKPALVWKHDGVKAKFAAPILHDGLLYVCDAGARIYCFDAEKGGKPLWRFAYGRNTKGSPLLADGKIYVSDVDGDFHILQPTRKGCKRLARVKFASTGVAAVTLHGSPAVADGKVYFTTTEQLVCIGKAGHDAKPDAIPAGPKEETMKAEAKATHLQIVPADLMLRPGEKAELSAYAYDDRGHRIGTVKVDWSLAGVRPPVYPIGLEAPKASGKPAPPPALAGELSGGNGDAVTFTAAKAPNGQFGRIVAKFGTLTGEARVRVVPNLPYTQDFEKVPEGRTPATWVNAPGKFSVVKLSDGNKVLSKRNDTSNALINQANTYITAPNARDYDIECDVYGTKVRDKEMPDMGISANRYVLVLLGNDQQVRLVTWDAQKRIEKLVNFPWKPGAWYRMKLTVQADNGKAVVRGKVWEKGQKEPKKWTVEITDPVPNREGAAMLYGYAQGSISAKDPGPNIYYDNLRITPRGKK